MHCFLSNCSGGEGGKIVDRTLVEWKQLILTVAALLMGAASLLWTQTPDASNILYVNSSVPGGNGSGNSWTNAIPQLADALKWARQQNNFTPAIRRKFMWPGAHTNRNTMQLRTVSLPMAAEKLFVDNSYCFAVLPGAVLIYLGDADKPRLIPGFSIAHRMFVTGDK